MIDPKFDISKFISLLFIVICNSIIFAAEKEYDSRSEYRDTIHNQLEFDSILKQAANKQNVDVYLDNGEYVVDTQQPIYRKFYLKGCDAIIKQKNKILTRADATNETSTHYICPLENVDIFSLFVDDTGKIIPISEDVDPITKVNYVLEDILSVEEDQTMLGIKKIKIKIPNNLACLKNKEFERAFGYIDSWWTAPSFAVTHSDSDYFYCELFQEKKKEQYNSYINGDKYQYKQPPGFVIYNVSPQPGRIFFDCRQIYIPKEYDSIEIINSENKPIFLLQDEAEVSFDGINILNSTSVLFVQKNNKGKLNLRHCKFRNILKQVIGTYYETALRSLNIEQCEFLDCAVIDGIPLIKIHSSECKGIIRDSYFNQYSDGICMYKSTATQYVFIRKCKEIEIINNKFLNIPRGGLFLLNGKINVIANEFYNEPNFNSYPYRNFSRDSGAIYCNRLFSDTRIGDNNPDKINLRLNKIHDIYGKGDIRGIFIDDGRGDVTCYGNLIYNGQLYSIDSRVIQKDPYSSIRNKYEYNIVALPYRLLYGDSIPIKDRPILENNILLFEDKENVVTTPSTTDIRSLNFKVNGNDVTVSGDVWMRLPDDVRNMLDFKY